MNYFRYLTRSPVTSSFLLICIMVAFWTSLEGNSRAALLMISATDSGVLTEVRHGEVWRLFTPMFLHFSLLHILFNMLWLIDLGVLIENRHGRFRLLLLILVISLVSNLGQYIWALSPYFGGMSGVVYGLLGYLWVFGRLNPDNEIQLNPTIVIFMLGWFVLCWTGLLGPIANMAHTVGLLMGMFLAWLFSPNKDIRKWRKPS